MSILLKSSLLFSLSNQNNYMIQHVHIIHASSLASLQSCRKINIIIHHAFSESTKHLLCKKLLCHKWYDAFLNTINLIGGNTSWGEKWLEYQPWPGSYACASDDSCFKHWGESQTSITECIEYDWQVESKRDCKQHSKHFDHQFRLKLRCWTLGKNTSYITSSSLQWV